MHEGKVGQSFRMETEQLARVDQETRSMYPNPMGPLDMKLECSMHFPAFSVQEKGFVTEICDFAQLYSFSRVCSSVCVLKK
jgi:hypothetical protein